MKRKKKEKREKQTLFAARFTFSASTLRGNGKIHLAAGDARITNLVFEALLVGTSVATGNRNARVTSDGERSYTYHHKETRTHENTRTSRARV